MPYAKAIAAFVAPYVLILVSPLGISSATTFEDAVIIIITAIITGLISAASVYFTPNRK